MVSGEPGAAISGNLADGEDKTADVFDFKVGDQMRFVPEGHGNSWNVLPPWSARTLANDLSRERLDKLTGGVSLS